MIVLLNLIVIILVMTPSFRAHVAPKIPEKLGKTFYSLATAHAALGSVAEIGGLYILLAAGTKLLPERLRLTEYKLWMRSVLVLWWLALLLGLATYAQWYTVIHVMGRCYGVESPDATMMGLSFDEVGQRPADRSHHEAPFAGANALDIAAAVSRAVYVDCDESELFLGMYKSKFTETIYSNRLIWRQTAMRHSMMGATYCSLMLKTEFV